MNGKEKKAEECGNGSGRSGEAAQVNQNLVAVANGDDELEKLNVIVVLQDVSPNEDKAEI